MQITYGEPWSPIGLVGSYSWPIKLQLMLLPREGVSKVIGSKHVLSHEITLLCKRVSSARHTAIPEKRSRSRSHCRNEPDVPFFFRRFDVSIKIALDDGNIRWSHASKRVGNDEGAPKPKVIVVFSNIANSLLWIFNNKDNSPLSLVESAEGRFGSVLQTQGQTHSLRILAFQG